MSWRVLLRCLLATLQNGLFHELLRQQSKSKLQKVMLAGCTMGPLIDEASVATSQQKQLRRCVSKREQICYLDGRKDANNKRALSLDQQFLTMFHTIVHLQWKKYLVPCLTILRVDTLRRSNCSNTSLTVWKHGSYVYR